jgi:hypothetical protein
MSNTGYTSCAHGRPFDRHCLACERRISSIERNDLTTQLAAAKTEIERLRKSTDAELTFNKQAVWGLTKELSAVREHNDLLCKLVDELASAYEDHAAMPSEYGDELISRAREAIGKK